MKDIQSDKAVNYIINQIKKLEKNVDEYKYEINSIELELKSICNKMNEVLNSGDKTQDLFTSTNCDKYIEKEYKNLCNKKESLENLKKKKISDLDEVINKINEMREVINNSSDEDSENVYNNKSESELNESDAEILWILEEDRQRISRDIHDTVVPPAHTFMFTTTFIHPSTLTSKAPPEISDSGICSPLTTTSTSIGSGAVLTCSDTSKLKFSFLPSVSHT